MTIDTLSLAVNSAGISLLTLNDTVGAAGLTLSAWINVTAFDGGNPGVIVGKSASTGNAGPWKLQIQDGGTGLRFIIGTGTGDTMLTDATVFATGTLTFVAGSYDGATMRTFVNGALTASVAKTGTINGSAANARIGGVDDGASFRRKLNGLIDDVRIYTRGLTAAELQTCFTARGHDAIKTSLLHRYLVNEAAPGVVAAGAGSIKDSAIGQFNGDPIFAPVYQASVLSHRRRYL